MSDASGSGERKSIGDRTGIQLSVIVAVVGFVIGGIWWAATINAKVDSILNMLVTGAQETAALKIKTEDQERRIWKLEQQEKRP